MEGTALYLVAVLLVSFPNSSQSQLYSLITPSVLRVETEETVVVEAHGHDFDAEVTVSVHDFPQKRNTLYMVKVPMNPANGMMVTATIKVSANDMKKDSKQKQYVIVVAKCPQFTLEKMVLVSFQSGYLFIQTDKTIYTPGSKVHYRIFSVNHNMQILDKPVIVEFETPEGIVDRQLLFNSTSRNFQPHPLPEIVSLGTWKIVAKYQDSPQETFTTQFDVKEYGSDMVVTERSGISLVTSPYQIHFTKTPKYFKPGMPFELMVFVTNPDGSPASRVPVVTEPIAADGTTQNDGTAKLILNTPANTQELRITVKTKDPQLLNEHQATKTMIATAYQTQGGSGNYLHLAVTATELKAGDNLPINFSLKSNSQEVLDQVQNFTYMILTKGKVFKVGRQRREAGQNLVASSLPITPELIPTFRIVAYYQVGNSEIVADSVWVDVNDTCMGTIWDSVEKSDIGCTAGSGRNNLGVFEDAGLALVTSNKLSTQQRSDPKCPQPASRRRRSVQLIESKASKGDFEDEFLADEDITSRTQFPESWLWRTEQLTAPPNDQGLGTWKTVAKYQDSPQETFATQFEVKEYVLPSFEVIVEPSEPAGREAEMLSTDKRRMDS